MAGNGNQAVGIVKEISNSNLNPDTQDKIIKKYINNDSDKEEMSYMDKIFGKKNPQMYVALCLSVLVLLVISGFTIMFKNSWESVKFIWNIGIPAITLLWGYAFGKSQQ